MNHLQRLTVAAGLIVAGASLAGAQSFTISSGFPPGTTPPIAHQKLADYLAANSDMKAEVFAMTLLNLQETAPGIRDGIVDMGYVLTPYYPAEFAHANLAGDMTMLATSGTPTAAPGLVMAGAFAEYVTLNCAECVQEFSAQNQVFLAGGSSSATTLSCTRPIEKVADLRNVKFRVGGVNFGRWAENFGGIKVSIPGSEMFEALSQGVVDCSMIASPDIANWQLFEVVSHVIRGIPGGVFAGVGSNNINLDTWRGLSTEQRETLLRGAALVTSAVSVGYHNAAIVAEQAARDKGLSVTDASEELMAASAEFAKKDMAVIGEQFARIYGLKDIETRMATISGLVESWKAAVAQIDPTSEEAYSTLLWDRVYSKVDPAAYAMN